MADYQQKIDWTAVRQVAFECLDNAWSLICWADRPDDDDYDTECAALHLAAIDRACDSFGRALEMFEPGLFDFHALASVGEGPRPDFRIGPVCCATAHETAFQLLRSVLLLLENGLWDLDIRAINQLHGHSPESLRDTLVQLEKVASLKSLQGLRLNQVRAWISREWAAVTGGSSAAGDEPPAVSLTEEEKTLANELGTSKGPAASPLCRHEQALKMITEALARIECTCKLRGRAGLLDLHRSLQRFFCQFLSVAFGLNLIELDNIQSNFPSIDLGDREGRRCFQITSNKSKDKVERTLRKYVAKRLHEQYGAITILVMGDRQRTYKSLRVPAAIQFDPEKDVLGLSELIKHVKTLESATLERLVEIAGAELHVGDQGQ